MCVKSAAVALILAASMASPLSAAEGPSKADIEKIRPPGLGEKGYNNCEVVVWVGNKAGETVLVALTKRVFCTKVA